MDASEFTKIRNCIPVGEIETILFCWKLVQDLYEEIHPMSVTKSRKLEVPNISFFFILYFISWNWKHEIVHCAHEEHGIPSLSESNEAQHTNNTKITLIIIIHMHISGLINSTSRVWYSAKWSSITRHRHQFAPTTSHYIQFISIKPYLHIPLAYCTPFTFLCPTHMFLLQ